MYNQTRTVLLKIFKGAMAILLLAALPSYAFDMDAAVAIYAEGQQSPQPQNSSQPLQAQPQQHSREYYQQRWLEQQRQNTQASAAHQPKQPQHAEQVTLEADDLFLAAVNGNNEQIGRLLSQGLDVNVSNSERETALHMAAAKGHYSTVIYLISNGAYTNARTTKNWIPLHHAARFRHHNIANYLIKRGSSAGVRTSDGLSAIDMARNVNDYRLLSILGAR